VSGIAVVVEARIPSDSQKGIFRRFCMKAVRMGNTFSAGQSAAEGQRIIGSGIAVKNQECEFPCRSDAVIFFMPT